MLAMQYSIQLPHSYDDALIHERVAQRSQLFDNLSGMTHKAFLYSRQDKLYAPFYIWENIDQAQNFLMDSLFQGVVETFNRPRVRSWFVQHQSLVNDGVMPRFGVQEIDLIAAEEKLEERIAYEASWLEELADNPNLYCALVALDPNRWEMIRYHLWKDEASASKPTADCVQTYEVLHVSAPK
jgi:hypothetical protein